MAQIAVRKYKRRRVFRVRIRRAGLKLSRQFDDRAAAEAYALVVEGDLAGRALGETTTLAELIAKYELHAPPSAARECLRYWRERLGHLRLGEITPAMIRAHRDSLAATPAQSHNQRTARPRSASTTRKYLTALSTAFQFAIRELGWAAANPVRLVSKPKPAGHRVRFLSDEERGRLLDAARRAKRAKWLYAAVLLSLTTGLRRGELHALLWRDVDLEGGLAVLRDTKNGTSRGIPLTPAVVAELTALQRDASGRVFPHEHGKAFRTAVTQAGLRDFRWHDLRHDAGSRLAGANVSTRTIMELLGHKTMGMALTYQHLTSANVRDAVLRVMAK